MRKALHLTVLACIFLFECSGQGVGVLSGKIFDETTREALSFASVVLQKDGYQEGGTTTNSKGEYRFVSLRPGKYDLLVSYYGYNKVKKTGITVYANQTRTINVALEIKVTVIPIIEIEPVPDPIVDPGTVGSGDIISEEELRLSPSTNILDVIATKAGFVTADEGDALHARGGQAGTVPTLIDGMPGIGSINIPRGSIAELQTVAGGVGAAYGDLSSGAVIITTKGPSNKFEFGADFLSSQLTDPYNFNQGSFHMSTPLIREKRKDSTKGRSILGIFIAAEFQSQETPDPAATGVYQLKDDVLQDLINDPLRIGGEPIGGVTPSIRNTQFVTADDLILSAKKPNAATNRMSYQAKLDFLPTLYSRFTVGSNYIRDDGAIYNRASSLFNSDRFGTYDNSTFRIFGRYTQKFKNDEALDPISKKKKITDAFYTIQIDYTNRTTSNQDARHGKNPWMYNYVGRYEQLNEGGFATDILTDTLRRSDGSPVLDKNGLPIIGDPGNGVVIPVQSSFAQPSGVNFKSGGDEVLTKFTNDWWGIYGDNIRSIDDMLGLGGIVNGFSNQSDFGVWTAPGRDRNGYGYTDNDVLRLTAQGSGKIGYHTFLFGMEFNQSVQKGYQFNPLSNNGIWLYGNGLLNRQSSQFDQDSFVVNYNVFGDVTDVERLRAFNLSEQTSFDKNLRKKLGAAAYDQINLFNVDPELLSVDLFSADEILREGRVYANYFGYDYLGEEGGNSAALDFFSDTEARPIAPYKPIYSAVYLQDKFELEDLVIRLGVRVDRFDANQPVLKDPYSFWPVKTVGETKSEFEHPQSVGNDFVVYVDDPKNPSSVVGYRKDNTWYDQDGKALRNAIALRQNSPNGAPTPYVKESTKESGTDLSLDALEDYTPTINVMPRLSISFPITDEALFFAHYDILTQRPSVGNRFNPVQYAYFPRSFIGSLINNPALKPQRTVDYEMGFHKKVGNESAIKISAFYREFRDMIQQTPIEDVFTEPGGLAGATYTTYGNIDFATVKGATIQYDLRKSKNMRINASYTLQFADGTGSNANSSAGLVSFDGSAQLRTIRPLDYDARHRILANIDFRFREDSAYNGPQMMIGDKKVQFLKNCGFNLSMIASAGMPYSRKKDPSADGDVAGGISGVNNLLGDINDANLPWNNRLNLRIDKNIKLGSKKKNAATNTKYLTIYCTINNLLDKRNVVNVYRYTGSPSDDGFLESTLGSQQIRTASENGSGQSFLDLYQASMQNPNNFSRPRTIRIGAAFNL